MDTGMIGKIEKAKRYVAEKSKRIQFKSLQVSIAGENNAHEIKLLDGKLICDCDFFKDPRTLQSYHCLGNHSRGHDTFTRVR